MSFTRFFYTFFTLDVSVEHNLNDLMMIQHHDMDTVELLFYSLYIYYWNNAVFLTLYYRWIPISFRFSKFWTRITVVAVVVVIIVPQMNEWNTWNSVGIFFLCECMQRKSSFIEVWWMRILICLFGLFVGCCLKSAYIYTYRKSIILATRNACGLLLYCSSFVR